MKTLYLVSFTLTKQKDIKLQWFLFFCGKIIVKGILKSGRLKECITSAHLENASKENGFVCMWMKKAQFEKGRILQKCGFAISQKPFPEAFLKFLTKCQTKEASCDRRNFTWSHIPWECRMDWEWLSRSREVLPWRNGIFWSGLWRN